jgi:hypothetical protein
MSKDGRDQGVKTTNWEDKKENTFSFQDLKNKLKILKRFLF